MADIGHILDKPPSTGITYYDETQEDVKVIMPDGNYKSNVISVETVVRDVKGIHRALIYNVKIRIAKESEDTVFDAVDMEGNVVKVNGGKFTGYELRSNGIFKFLHPDKEDEFEANPGGNKAYANFCRVLGKEPKIVDVEFNGEKISMKELPSLEESDILGKPVISVLGRGKPWVSNKDGKTRTPMAVKWFRTWVNGSTLSSSELEGDDLPF